MYVVIGTTTASGAHRAWRERHGHLQDGLHCQPVIPSRIWDSHSACNHLMELRRGTLSRHCGTLAGLPCRAGRAREPWVRRGCRRAPLECSGGALLRRWRSKAV